MSVGQREANLVAEIERLLASLHESEEERGAAVERSAAMQGARDELAQARDGAVQAEIESRNREAALQAALEHFAEERHRWGGHREVEEVPWQQCGNIDCRLAQKALASSGGDILAELEHLHRLQDGWAIAARESNRITADILALLREAGEALDCALGHFPDQLQPHDCPHCTQYEESREFVEALLPRIHDAVGTE